MSNETHISFYLASSRIHVFRKTIIEIGNPRFIRFLVNEDGQSMIMEAYDKKDFHSHCVPKVINERWQLEISSMALCKLLKNRLQWEDGESYRIKGKIYSSQHLAVFDLDSAEHISRQASKPDETVLNDEGVLESS